MEPTNNELKFLYLAFDLIILNLVILIVLPIFALDLNDHNLYFLQANLAEIIAYTFFSKESLYFNDDFYNKIKYWFKRFQVFVMAILVTAYVFLPNNFSRIFIFEYIIIFAACKLLLYFLIYIYFKYRRHKGIYSHRVLFVGYNELGLQLSYYLKNNSICGCKFVGFISDNQEMENKNILGKFDDLEQVVMTEQIDLLFVTSSIYNEIKECRDLLSLCYNLGVRVRIIPENQYWIKSCTNLELMSSLLIIKPHEIPLDRILSRFFKRLFDIIFSTFVIIFIISWLFPIISLIIKLSSKGPVFFIQNRTGINNKTFKCLKFRSMCVNKDADVRQACNGDMRITRIGSFLRKSSIDELPQFFNVLIGQMSVVGPRPHMLKHTEQYSKLINYYLARHLIKPGITGWAQVSGYRGETDELWKMRMRVDYDIHYIENWNFMWDIKIIFMTVFANSLFEYPLGHIPKDIFSNANNYKHMSEVNLIDSLF